MSKEIKLVVSHAPFWHNGSCLSERSYHTMLAALPAVLAGIFLYGMPAVGVVALSMASAMFWELGINFLRKSPKTIGDGNAALIGLLFAMLMPATTPWWAVLTGTLVAVVIGKQIFGGIGGNPFNPTLIGVAILMVSWPDFFDFDQALLNYDLGFKMIYPLAAVKHFGTSAVSDFTVAQLLLGWQVGGIGATFGLGLLAGGAYLILRGFIRWEISLAFLAGIFLTALIFSLADSARFAGPALHLLSGYTLIGALFLAPEDSSSPVNLIPMFIYGAGAGILTVLIRNIGAYVDGVVLAILIMNLVNPLIDKIRPKAIGKVV